MSDQSPGVNAVRIGSIITDPRYQVREQGADRKRVKVLVEVYRDNPSAMPPLVVVERIGVKDGAGYVLIDGHARLEVLRELGATEVPIVFDTLPASASDNERVERAWSLNVGHGFPPTLGDRKAMAVWRRATFPAESISETARRCGLNRATIALLGKVTATNKRDAAAPDPLVQAFRALETLSHSDALARDDEVEAIVLLIDTSYENDDDLRDFAESLHASATTALAIAAELEAKFE